MVAKRVDSVSGGSGKYIFDWLEAHQLRGTTAGRTLAFDLMPGRRRR